MTTSCDSGSARRNHPLRPPGAVRGGPRARATAASVRAPAWPSYTGTPLLVGTSASGVSVYVDRSLDSLGLQNAVDLLAAADRVMAQNNDIFGITGGPVDVIVFAIGGQTDGTGGADHDGCDFVTGGAIEADASYGDSACVIALFEAELSECAMNGQLCGLSTGEALSRWCAALVGANALSDFATAPTWAQDGMPNWVDQTEGTDEEPDSIGCGMAFLSWVLAQGYSLSLIAQTMVGLGDTGTLAGLYGELTGWDPRTAWPDFTSSVNALAEGVTSDDPFGALCIASAALPPSA